jgi:hypothetical protein
LLFLAARPGCYLGRMKPFLPLLFLAATTLLAEQVTVRESVILKAERAAVSVKAGTEVELIARDGDTVTIKYHNVTGKIPARKLAAPADATEAPKAAGPKPAETKPAATVPSTPLPADAKPSAGQTPGLPQQTTVPKPPQTTYGKAVQKAKDNAAAHDKNAVKPADEILKQ